LEQARKIADDFEGLRQEMEKIQLLVSEFENRLPLRREIPRLLKEFEALADEVGLEVELETQLRVRDQRKETIPYSIIARGDFHRVASFINRLERFKRYLKISELSVGEEEQGICEAKFTLSTFRFIEPGLEATL
jgi:Tfp pilus assembly protein PilO